MTEPEKITDELIAEYVAKRANMPIYRGANYGCLVVEDVFKTNPSHQDIKSVLLKVAVLNDLYHTHLSAPFKMAQHIKNIPDLADKINDGDPAAVAEIASLYLEKTPARDVYIFATKYCFFSNPEKFFIYDPMVAKMLSRYLHLSADEEKRLQKYHFFAEKMSLLIQKNHIKSSHKNLDIFLWTMGKERSR